ncbi:wax ester/triacylglycerol synthase family O-acyltransferase [Solicola gregarius]|uniref:Diacylglycerol O-acyltransferase n=2 Tax=Solicola gregarius TaxID=2908642 RepID=A0AA46TEU6_9ACTN|nr:wax ester/triacylglycerol synthase family O-acyltransferase [Solicola gregarius]
MPDRLDPVAAMLLAEETTTAPRHVATLAVLEGDSGLDYDRLVSVVNERIALVPRYRQRVLRLPGNVGAPVWADDDFDLSFHVRRSALPKPGTMASLRELVARLIARPLDLDRPLWEAYLVEGVGDDRVALLIKSHQALVDGSETVDLAQVLLEETAYDREVPADDWRPRPAPNALRLAGESIVETITDPRRILGTGVSLAGKVVARLPVLGNHRVDPHSVLSADPSQQRRFATVHTQLDDYRTVRDAHGGTVNDVVLSAIAGGLRAWLLTRAEPVSAATRFRALVPMSVVGDDGDDDAPTSLGSAVRGHLLSLPVGEGNPVVRLHQVSYALKAHRETGLAVAASQLASLPGFAPTTFHAVGSRVADTQPKRSFHLAVTNVPGPQEPMYMAGARVLEVVSRAPADGRAGAVDRRHVVRRCRVLRHRHRSRRDTRRRCARAVHRGGAGRARRVRRVESHACATRASAAEGARPPMTRVFVPASPADLRTLAAGGAIAPGSAYAATRSLADEYPDADDEELVFAAMMAAAEDCTHEPAIVVAADLEAAETSTPGAVELANDLLLDRVAAFHVGSPSNGELGWYATQELDDLIAQLG